MKYLIQTFEKKQTATGKDYIRATLKDEESETEIPNVSIWSDFPNFEAITGFDTVVEGEIVEKNGFKNLKAPYAPRAGGKANFNGLMEKKNESIEKFQDKKSAQIEKAQDRSALMWAKVGAAELIAHHPAFKNLTVNEIDIALDDLTTKIYNGEPSTPF